MFGTAIEKSGGQIPSKTINVTIVGRISTLTMASIAGGFGVVAPPIAAAIVLAGGWLTPGYDPIARTISRLAEPGLPVASAVELAICLVGIASLGLAIRLGPGLTVGRCLLGAAGSALLVSAAIRLDPVSTQATTEHRLATTIAMVALAVAPLAWAGVLDGPPTGGFRSRSAPWRSAC